jgi:hypothetical protein
VKPGQPPYFARDGRKRQRQQAARRRLAVVVVVLLAVVIVVLALALPRGGKTTNSTSTSGAQTSSSSTTNTISGATTTLASTDLSAGGAGYSATLSGQDEVPARSTAASGVLTVTVQGDSVHYSLVVSAIVNASVARLHEGKAGTTGATVATLFTGPTKAGTFTGTLADGSLTAADLLGPLKGKTVADLIALIKSGSVYLNVGTSGDPTGEIRGQLH